MLEANTLLERSIFRAYDIRGVVDEGLTGETVYKLGKAIGTRVFTQGEKLLAFARDGRLSSPELSKAFVSGVLSTGCDVIDIGIVPTPLLYYVTHILKTQSGVMLTGSHNPAEYNGLKIVFKGRALAQEEIQSLYHQVLNNDFCEGAGEIYELDVIDRYIVHVTQTVRLARPLKIVVDCGNGVPAVIAPSLFRALGCEVHELFCDVDGKFPNHHPDPSQAENLQALIQKVAEIDADIGLAFDGDGDRLGVVTNKGKIIWPDRQLMLFAKDIISRNPGAKIIYDVKCTQNLESLIRELGGEPIMWKTGHSLIKSKLAETKALLAGEMSGHVFIKDRWYGFDDALYAGARLLEILSRDTESSDAIFNQFPNSVNTPELKIHVSESEKFSLMDQLVEHANFTTALNVNTIDGLRVNFATGWGLIRPSNTTPCLILRFEADSEKVLNSIQELFRTFLLSVKADLVLPF